jgi:transcriptional regulator with XRE-family HTH domain
MESKKLARLKEKGIEPTTVGELLGLPPSEVALIDLKLYFGKFVREIRRERRVTQAHLAKLMGSSQPRVATIEKGIPPVSLDLIFRALLALDVPIARIAHIIDAFEPPDYTGPRTIDLVTEAQRKKTKNTRTFRRHQLEEFRQQPKDGVDVELDA